MEENEGEQQAERNRQGGNNRCSHADEEKDQHNKDENHSAQQIVFHSGGRQVHQAATVVESVDFNILRQNLSIQILCFFFDSLQDILGLLAGPHHDDTFDSIIIVHKAELAEPWGVADRHLADVADKHRGTLMAGHNNIADVMSVPNQTDPPHVIKLTALRIETSACVGIIGGKGLEDLGDGNVITVKLSWIQ